MAAERPLGGDIPAVVPDSQSATKPGATFRGSPNRTERQPTSHESSCLAPAPNNYRKLKSDTRLAAFPQLTRISEPRNLLLLFLVAHALLGCTKDRTVYRPLDSSSPANGYINEFREFKFPPSNQATSPDHSVRIEDKSSGGGPLLAYNSCHTLSAIHRSGLRHHILTAREIDPGSGSDIRWGWSRDSKALFIFGQHSGLDCRGKLRGTLSLIYMIEENSSWEVSRK